jgi:hypothetical protein
MGCEHSVEPAGIGGIEQAGHARLADRRHGRNRWLKTQCSR